MRRLDGKVALIYGSAIGQGDPQVLLLAEEGASVVFGDTLDEQGQRVKAEIDEIGGESLFLHLDTTSWTDWESAVSAAIEKYGKIDIIVNNAASGIEWSEIGNRAAGVWGRISEVGAMGEMLGVEQTIPEAWSVGSPPMIGVSSLVDIQKAISNLDESDYKKLVQWMNEQDWERWDAQIETDSESGKLDFLEVEALEAKRDGTLGEL